jgi:hypothetical protein
MGKELTNKIIGNPAKIGNLEIAVNLGRYL